MIWLHYNIEKMAPKRRPSIFDNDSEIAKPVRKITGRDLTDLDEVSIRLNTLINMLEDKGIINRKEYDTKVIMRLHEVSKATAFEKMDEEI